MASSKGRSDRRGPRTPGLVFTGLTVVLVLTLVVIALTTRQPPPPTIAEFAPQAVEQIKDAPTEQSSQFGSGEGGGGLEGSGAGPEAAGGAARQVIDVPRVRRCIGDPPRQIEDPQSPPCVPYWDGDNGGATWPGVTRNEVRVVIPTAEAEDEYAKWEQFFNKRFEFYGRRLRFLVLRNDLGAAPPATQQADAAKTQEELNAFITSHYRASGGYYYHEELARRKVLTVTGAWSSNESEYLRSRRPYVWQYLMAADAVFSNMGSWTCSRLGNATAAYAGPQLRSTRRTYGIVLQTFYDGDKTSTRALEDELKRCEIEAKVVLRNPVRTDAGGEASQPTGNDPNTSRTTVAKLQAEGVTSVLCMCNYFTTGALMRAATNQAWFPEWLLSTYGPNDNNKNQQVGGWPPEQTEHAFGLTFKPRQIDRNNEPFWWAVREVDATAVNPGDAQYVNFRAENYRPLLLIAAGIQMAGPRLTPQTFEAALHRTRFPNPDHPNRSGAVGFGGASYSMTTDGAEWWYSNTASSPYSGGQAGAFCYLDGGTRHGLSKWPTGDGPFFKPPCDSGA